MIKKITVKIISCILITTLSLCGCSSDSQEAPTFEKNDRGIVFGAYAAPTVKGQVNEQVIDILDDAYKKMSEAGFTKVIALYEGFSGEEGADVYDTIQKRSVNAQKVALIALNLCEKYGMKYWVRDWSFYGLCSNYEELQTQEDVDKAVSVLFNESNEYINHPAYGGNFGYDEPNVQEMEKIVWQTKAYQKYIEQYGGVGGEIYINLLPCYASDQSMSLSRDMSYSEYLNYYFDHIAPLTKYISWDFYPFKSNTSSGNYIRDTYYYNLELAANRCKKDGYELRAFIQAKGDFTGMRQLESIEDLRFEIYSNLAFGARELYYYTYSSAVDESDYTFDDGYSLYNYKNNTYTWMYDAAKQVNNEIHQMEDAYLAYQWDGVMYKNADPLYDNQLFANLTTPMESHDRMSIESCTNDVLAAVFKAKDQNFSAQDAFMFVNATEPSEKKPSEVTVKFKKAGRILMYRYGEQIVVPLASDGSYTFKLQPGEGRFVIPLK